MRILFLIILLLKINAAKSQTARVPSWFTESFKSKGLEKKYKLQPFLTPQSLQADFNGDSNSDVAVLVVEKVSKKKGILIIHQITKDHFVFGAGTKLDQQS
ncbi:hypothetical protein GZH53_00785 [Flavihumibacter sp. R14]|nr:hypothetical protein [Flavihumibacter soli]